MTHNELWKLEARELAALIASGELSSVDVVASAIDRIKDLNPLINAVVSDAFDRALLRAHAAPTGAPFEGVPILLKDAGQEIEGLPHYLGSTAMKTAVFASKTTTPFAAKLEQLGFVVLGKTNVPELSSGITTEPAAFGPTRNPWNLERIAGGSSGGSAAAVAAGLTPIAHGSDGTGSLRYPASACGVAALKPSRGIVVSTPPAGMLDPLELWTDFVLTRTVADTVWFFEQIAPSMAGSGDADHTKPLKIGLLAHDPLLPIALDDECVTAVNQAGRLLEDLGHDVSYDYPPALQNIFAPIGDDINLLAAVTRAAQTRWIEGHIGRPLKEGDLDPQLLAEAADAAAFSSSELDLAVENIRTAMGQIESWWRNGFDILVTPTMRQPPWALGETTHSAFHSGIFVVPFSFTGQPAISLPLHWTSDNLPIGVQLVAAQREDRKLLALAEQLESAAPWRDRWPLVAMNVGVGAEI
jgi:amidase